MPTTSEIWVSLYVRLSGAADEANLSLKGMIAELTAHVESLGMRVYAVHVDEGLSGGVRDRPEFLAWLDDARSGKVPALAAFHGDRVTREGVNAAALVLDVVEGKNPDTGAVERPPVRFVSYDGLDSERDPESFRWRFIISAETARAERNSIRRRNTNNRRRLRAAGRLAGGRRAWAFTSAPRPDGAGLRLVPIPEHAEAIRWALEHLRAGGSKTAIVREWTARGLTPKGSAKARRAGTKTAWHVTPVTRILSNPNLYGAAVHGGEPIREEDGTVRVDPAQAILSLAEWLVLQGLLSARSTVRSSPDREDPALCAGLLYCGSCGRLMYPHRPSGGRKWTYRCRGGVNCPAPVSVLISAADEYLTGEFRRLLGDVPESLGGWEPDVISVDPVELVRLQEALDNVQVLLTGDVDDEEALTLLRQRRELRERLAVLQDAVKAADAAQEVRLREVESARTFGEAFDAAKTVAERTNLLALAFDDRVTVQPGDRGAFDPSRLEW